VRLRPDVGVGNDSERDEVDREARDFAATVTPGAARAYGRERSDDMDFETLIKDTRSRLQTLARKLTFLAPALLRITLGVVFIQTGWGHLTHLADTVDAFRNDFGVPFPELNARLASGTEFFGGVLILLGLGARVAALPMAFTMLVAIATAKRAQLHGLSVDSFTTLLGFEEWSYLVMFLVIAIGGPGALSLDALVMRRLRRKSEATLPRPLLQPSPVRSVNG
jgi:putative oxidoreductase